MSLGRRLAAARAERGLDLEDVSRATRIRVPILQALESDDLAAAGPPAYVRGHLRTLAGLLGLDADVLVHDYERRAPAAPATPQTWQVRDPAVARADRRTPSWLGATVVAMAAVVTTNAPSQFGVRLSARATARSRTCHVSGADGGAGAERS